MTLLIAGGRRRDDAPTPPGAIPSPVASGYLAVDSIAPLVIDYAQAVEIVRLSEMTSSTGTIHTLREQDDIIWDPVAGQFVFYFTDIRGGIEGWMERSYIWRCTSADGVTFSAPVECTEAGAPLWGQDPSLVQTFGSPTPSLYRDGGGLLWMYLENNAKNTVKVLSSTDGLAWTTANATVIAKGEPGAWDASLTGSPIARHDGNRFIVGYEGINDQTESAGVAFGTSPTALTKHPANPIFTAASVGAPGTSAFFDSMWAADGRILFGGHSGLEKMSKMFRAYTTNLDPSTWAQGDFVFLGDIGTDIPYNDLTMHMHGGRIVTQPQADNTFYTAPLKLP